MAPEMRDNDVPIFHLLSQTVNWHLRPDSFYIVFFAKAPAERCTISGGSFKYYIKLCTFFSTTIYSFTCFITFFICIIISQCGNLPRPFFPDNLPYLLPYIVFQRLSCFALFSYILPVQSLYISPFEEISEA